MPLITYSKVVWLFSFLYFFFRQIQFKDTPENKYQATLVWPQASKKPSTASLLTADELNQIMIRFAVAINQKPIGHQVIYLLYSSNSNSEFLQLHIFNQSGCFRQIACKNCSNSWMLRFVVSGLVVGSGEQWVNLKKNGL